MTKQATVTLNLDGSASISVPGGVSAQVGPDRLEITTSEGVFVMDDDGFCFVANEDDPRELS